MNGAPILGHFRERSEGMGGGPRRGRFASLARTGLVKAAGSPKTTPFIATAGALDKLSWQYPKHSSFPPVARTFFSITEIKEPVE